MVPTLQLTAFVMAAIVSSAFAAGATSEGSNHQNQRLPLSFDSPKYGTIENKCPPWDDIMITGDLDKQKFGGSSGPSDTLHDDLIGRCQYIVQFPKPRWPRRGEGKTVLFVLLDVKFKNGWVGNTPSMDVEAFRETGDLHWSGTAIVRIAGESLQMTRAFAIKYQRGFIPLYKNQDFLDLSTHFRAADCENKVADIHLALYNAVFKFVQTHNISPNGEEISKILTSKSRDMGRNAEQKTLPSLLDYFYFKGFSEVMVAGIPLYKENFDSKREAEKVLQYARKYYPTLDSACQEGFDFQQPVSVLHTY